MGSSPIGFSVSSRRYRDPPLIAASTGSVVLSSSLVSLILRAKVRGEVVIAVEVLAGEGA